MKLRLGRLDRWIAAALGTLLIAGFVVSQRPHPRHEPLPLAAAAPARRVTTTAARKETVPIHVEAIGALEAKRRSTLSARILARVLEIRKRPGERFEAGEPLILLESEDLQARAAGAEALLQANEESLRDARREEERAKALVEKEAITRQEYEAATTRFAEAAAHRDVARKALDAALVELQHAALIAPFRGVVVETLADVGDTAAPGKPLLEICDPAELRLETAVDERIALGLAVGMELQVMIDASREVATGRIGEMVPAVDPATRTQTLRIDLPGSAGLRPGAAARARIPAGTREAVVVESAAVARRGQLECVFMLENGPRPEARTARLRLVRTARDAAPLLEARGLVEIASGAEPGTPIALPALGLEDGAAVEIAPQGPASGARP